MIQFVAVALAQDAQVRVLHLSPDAPGVDVFVGGSATAAVADLAFLEGTGYLPVPSGDLGVVVAPAGAGPGQAVIDATLALEPGADYSVVAYGPVADLGALVLRDDASGVAADEVRLQIAHTAVGVGPATVSVLDLGVRVGTLGFGETTTADVPATPHLVTLDAGGRALRDFSFQIPALPGGSVVDVFAVTDAQGAPWLVAHLPDGAVAAIPGRPTPKAQVRALHLSPDAPAVDVAVFGYGRPVTDLSYGEGTGYLDVDAGRRGLAITAAGTNTAVSAFRSWLRPGEAYTAVAYGALADLRTDLLRDLEPGGAGEVNLRVVHAADGVGTVDLRDEVSDTVLLAGVPYGANAALAGVPAGARTVGLDVDRDGTSDLTFDLPDLGDRTSANVYAILDTDGAALMAQLPDGTVVRIPANP